MPRIPVMSACVSCAEMQEWYYQDTVTFWEICPPLHLSYYSILCSMDKGTVLICHCRLGELVLQPCLSTESDIHERRDLRSMADVRIRAFRCTLSAAAESFLRSVHLLTVILNFTAVFSPFIPLVSLWPYRSAGIEANHLWLTELHTPD